MNIVNYEKLKEILQGLWNRIKEKFVEEIKFDTTPDPQTNKPKNTLIQKKDGQETEVVNHVVTEWQDLEYVTEYSFPNLVDYDNKKTGFWYGNSPVNGDAIPNSRWSICEINVKEGTQYTIVRKRDDSRYFVLFNNDTFVSEVQPQVNVSNAWRKQVVDIPVGVNKLGFCFQHDLNTRDSIMAFEGDVTPPVDFVKYTDGCLLQVGHEVSLEFDNTNTTINSATISGAIKELSQKNQSIDWKNLSYTEQHNHVNIMDYDKKINNRWYDNDNGIINVNNSWSVYELEVVNGRTYTILRRGLNDSSRFVFFNNDVHVETINVQTNHINDWHRQEITITNPNVNKVHFCFQHGINTKNKIMVIEGGNINEPLEYIPHLDGEKVLIGQEVALAFDNTNTNLVANTHARAIRELDANKISTTLIGNSADKIPLLDGQGKLVNDIIPEIAITKIVDVATQNDALNQADSNDIQIGDFVRLTNEQNKIYQYSGIVSGDFNTRFVEFSLGDATVKTINNEQPQNGNFRFELEETNDAIGLKVNSQTITSTPLATRVEIDNLKNSLSF